MPSLRVIHLLGWAFGKTQRCWTRPGLLFDGWVYFASLFFRLGFTKKSHPEASAPNPRPHYENLSSALYRPPNVIKTSGLRSLLALSLTHVYVLDTASADIFGGSSFSVLRKFSDLQMQYSKRKLEKTLFSVVLNRVKKYKGSQRLYTRFARPLGQKNKMTALHNVQRNANNWIFLANRMAARQCISNEGMRHKLWSCCDLSMCWLGGWGNNRIWMCSWVWLQ